MSRYNIHAGHNPAGKIACGANGLLNESKEDRLIAREVIRLLKLAGHTVYDCTVDNGTGQSDVLKKIAAKCNKHTVDLDVSIHLNAGRGDKKGDKKVGGTEVLCTAATGIKKDAAARIRKNMKALGFTDRGTKTTSGLYILNRTKNKAILIEVCFVDDKDDYNLYKKVGYKKIAEAIAEGITGKEIKEKAPAASSKPAASAAQKGSYKVKVTADVLNVRKFAANIPPVVTQVRRNEVYTIVKTSGNWGKLKSGAGWISLRYTKRV